MLKIDDDSFFDTHAPLPLAKELPGIKDAVMVYGYPEGGTTLSITKGIVSRIEFVPYNLQTQGLRVQIDAAINPGNSGGPAVAGDHMIGVAFSRLTAGRRTSATSSRPRRSSCSSRTSPTATTTANPRCSTSSRRSKTRT